MKIKHLQKIVPLVLLQTIALFLYSSAEDNLPLLVKKIQPAVVLITTYDSIDNPIIRGTGFFVDSKGYVVSNNHVFKDAVKATVKSLDGKVYPVSKILAKDLEGDLILFSVDIKSDAVKLLNVSTKLAEIGEKVIVIGNPAGFEQTVSDGIISAVRNIPGFGNIIQITAPISPGSSGSPVVNLKGEVIGVATLISTAGQNLNFAIPGERVISLNSNATVSFNRNNTDVSTTKSDNLFNDNFTDAKDILSLGKQKLSVNQYSEAIDLFSEVLHKNNKCLDAYYYRALANNSINEYKSALADVNCAISINPKLSYFYKLRGEINSSTYLNDNTDFNRALLDYSKAIEIDTLDYANYLGRANTYQLLGRVESAIADFSNALQRAPNTDKSNILRKRCASYLSLNQPKLALLDATKAIEYLKRFPCFSQNGEDFLKNAYEERAHIYDDKLNDYALAIQDYKKVLQYITRNNTTDLEQKKSDVFGIQQSLAYAFNQLGQPDSAIAYFSMLISQKGDLFVSVNSTADKELQNIASHMNKNWQNMASRFSNYELRAINYAKKRQFKLAIADYTTIINNSTSHNDSIKARIARGDLFFDLGQYEDALKDFEAMPDHWRIIKVYEKTNRDDDIIALCNKIQKEYPDRYYLHYLRGKAYFRKKNNPEAVADLNKYLFIVKKNVKEMNPSKTELAEANKVISEIDKLLASIK